MAAHVAHQFQARPEPFDSKNWCLGDSTSFANLSRARRSVHSAACTIEQRVPLGVQRSRGRRSSAARLDQTLTAAARPGRLRRSCHHRAASMAATALRDSATSRATMPPSHEIYPDWSSREGWVNNYNKMSRAAQASKGGLHRHSLGESEEPAFVLEGNGLI